MKIVMFNINGVKVCIGVLIDWFEIFKLDVVLFQEIKFVDENFFWEYFEDMGYCVEIYG